MKDQNREENFLAEINQYLPSNVDWKRGAIEYLEQLIKNEGDHNEIYHLIKPFIGGPDFDPFFSEMYGFLNILHHINLPMKSKVLDVACGPGWTSHFLAKLGYDAVGVDISPDLIEMAKKRVAMDPFAPYEGMALSAHFLLHDMEKEPIPIDTTFEAAFFESALHHFLNPIAALRNISSSLREDGILCIWEGAAPEPGTPSYNNNFEIMKKYRTLERPYSRDQLIELLLICGYSHYEFYSQVNGLFNEKVQGDIDLLNNQLASSKNWNICIASRTDTFFKKKSRSTKPVQIENIEENIEEEIGKKSNCINPFWSMLTVRDQEEFISSIYNSILHRSPDLEGLRYYRSRSNNIFSRLIMIMSLLKSNEYKNLKKASK